jgi:hypothetical protein
VLLSKLATCIPGNATTTSKFRRLQDVFCEVLLDVNAVAALLMGVIGKLANEPLTLALDKTNWKTHRNDVNIPVPSVCLDDVGLPIFWIDLRMPGNSDIAFDEDRNRTRKGDEAGNLSTIRRSALNLLRDCKMKCGIKGKRIMTNADCGIREKILKI